MRDVASAHAAPELRVAQWIDAKGDPMQPLTLADLGTGFKVIYCFQHWCAGCHSHGFPTLQALVRALSDRGFAFAAVQTVFEGVAANTFERLRETQLRYGLAIPFGHDVAPGQLPSLMADYETYGTPWFIVIDPQGALLHSDFELDAPHLLQSLGLADPPPTADQHGPSADPKPDLLRKSQ